MNNLCFSEYRSPIKTEAIYNKIDYQNEELAEQITYFTNDDSGIDLKLEYQLQNVSSEKTLEEDSFLSTEHDAGMIHRIVLFSSFSS